MKMENGNYIQRHSYDHPFERMNITEVSRPTYRGCAVPVSRHRNSVFTFFNLVVPD